MRLFTMLALGLVLLLPTVGLTQWHPARLAPRITHRAQPAVTSPTLAIAELQRVVLHHFREDGDDNVRAFVYRVYLSSGARNGMEVLQGVHQLVSRQESRDILLGALCATYQGNARRLEDVLAASFGMNLVQARALAHYVAAQYPAHPDR